MSEKNSPPSIEHLPYSKIGDAHPESAFLTNKNGYDVAVLRRVLPKNVTSEHQPLSDEQWQKMINLIDAAPDLLNALLVIVNDAEPGESAQLTTNGYNLACAAIAKTKLL